GADLSRLSHGRPAVRADRLRGRRPRRPRRHAGRADRGADRGRRRGRGLVRGGHRLERGPVSLAVHRHPDRAAGRTLRPARRRGPGRVRRLAPAVAFFVAAGLVPLVVRDAFLIDGLVLILVWGASAAAWNLAGGYAGQVSLGHSAFFGLGAYGAALLGTRWGLSP